MNGLNGHSLTELPLDAFIVLWPFLSFVKPRQSLPVPESWKKFRVFPGLCLPLSSQPHTNRADINKDLWADARRDICPWVQSLDGVKGFSKVTFNWKVWYQTINNLTFFEAPLWISKGLPQRSRTLHCCKTLLNMIPKEYKNIYLHITKNHKRVMFFARYNDLSS